MNATIGLDVLDCAERSARPVKESSQIFSADDLRYARRATTILGSGLRNHAEREKDLSRGEREVLDKTLKLLHVDPNQPTKDELEILSVIGKLLLAFDDSAYGRQSAFSPM